MNTTKDPSTIANEIASCRLALEVVTTDIQKRAELLKQLADALYEQYYAVSHSVVTLQEAILVYEDVLQLRAPEDKNRAEAAEDLGFAIYRLCAFHEGAKKIDRSVELLREALHLRPPGDPLREGPLRRLAGALLFLRGQGGDHDLRILTEIIAHSQEALQLCSSGHPGRVRALGILSSALHSHFRVSSDPVMLNDAIRLQQETLELCDRGGHARIAALINLSSLLMDSFRYYGGFDKAAEAVAVLREALQLSPVGTPGRFMTIDNLACALGENFKQTGHKTSLAEAISLGREALQLLPAAHNQRRRIAGNLAESLLLDFREHGDTRVLDESVTLLRESVPAYAVGHSHRISLMTLLAEALQLSSALYGPMALEEAISVYTEALEACPFDSFRRVLPLEKLADLYCGLDQPSWVAAHVLYCEALELSPIGRPARSQLLCGLSRCYLDPKSPFFDIHEGVKHLLQAYTDNYCHVNRRLKSAIADLERVEVAYKAQQHLPDLFTCTRDSSQILDLYAGIVGLLPRAANFGLAHQTRFQAVAGLDELTRSAVTRAILLGRVAQAVEFLEEGRGVFWSQSLHLRANGFDNVPERDRRELERLLCLLDFSARRDQSSDLNVVQLEKNLETRRRLNNEAEHLISRIRGYPGLSRFLLPPSFRGLMEALPPGYVVIVNTSRLGHHALLLHKGFRLAAGLDLDLPRYKFDSASVRAQLPRDMSADVAVQQHGDTVNRAMRLNTVSTSTLEDILALVWTSIAMPIIRKLGLQKSDGRSRPRLWWCVTGDLGFLPIHAAGTYRDTTADSTARYAVSSYIPTLSSLTKARHSWQNINRTELAGLLVCEESTDDGLLRRLPKASQEVRVIRECFNSAGAKVLNPDLHHTSVHQLHAALEGTQAHVLHFACHASQDSNPLKSGLLLQDGKFAIEDIMQLELPRAVLAYLSACQTAKGDRFAPDQAVHLAASMLFSGFRSVIGTMWLMHDEDGPKLARHFYEALFQHDYLDLDDIPFALDEAVQHLRSQGVPARRWALFMHMGG